MKKTLLLLLFVTITVSVFSQTLPPIDAVRLKSTDDYRAADTVAQLTARYLIGTPVNRASETRLKAYGFLLNWMGGTPTYTFSLDNKATKYFHKDVDLMSVYAAALVLTEMENKSLANANKWTLISVKRLIVYIKESGNGVTITSRLQKLVDACDKGELESFLNL
jgi:3-oxoacyl-ACP reductase-like protein